MAATQDHVLIKDIREDVVLLKDGSMAIVIETSAVNFGLLSDNEQYAIISSFAGMLNSLSFAIQIVIRSKRLDISHYLDSLKDAQETQKNPLLFQMIERYRSFIRETVRENDVLDKQFYIVIPLSYLEIGLSKNTEFNFKKAMTLLLPRRDHIIRQLARCGLRSDQLTSEDLVTLFHDIYNGQAAPMAAPAGVQESAPAPTPEPPQVSQQPTNAPLPQNPSTPLQPALANAPVSPSQPAVMSAPAPTPRPVAAQTTPPQSRPQPVQPAPTPRPPVAAPPSTPASSAPRRNPFVVEELPDDYGTV